MDLKDLLHQEIGKELKVITDRLNKPQLLPFLLNHERRGRFEEKVRLQIFGIAKIRHNIELDTDRVKKIAQAGAQVFAKLAIEAVTKSHMSAAELARQTKENSKEQEAEAWFLEEQRKLSRPAEISKSMYIPDAKIKEEATGSTEGSQASAEARTGPV